VVVDAGDSYAELRGVELRGSVLAVGEAPRIGRPSPVLPEVETAWSLKYHDRASFSYDERHGWLCLTPAQILSWDFRKL
jgi:hypothetical protein